MLTEYLPVREVPEEAARFIRVCLPPQSATGGSSGRKPGAVQHILNGLIAPNTSAWVAKVDGRIEAIFGAQLRHVSIDDPEYTYMPERYGFVSLSGWHVASDDGWRYAKGLLDHIFRDAKDDGIDRLSVEVPVGNATALRTLLNIGFEPDVILAGTGARTGNLAQPTGVIIRRAREDDADDLLALTIEEADYHAWNTDTGTLPNQEREPSEKLVDNWLNNQRIHDLPTFVAERDGRVVGMVPLMFASDDAAGEQSIPRTYGYIGSTCVTSSERGTGIGSALIEHVLDAAHRRGMTVLLVHFVADNVLSAPFWTRRGFTPVTVTMLKRHGMNE